MHVGTIGDPLGDALDALAAEGSDELVDRIESLAGTERAWLAETVASHASQLAGLVPRFAPGWLPRTDDRIAIPLAGGRVVLHGVADLLVGVPQPDVASLCALGLTTGGPWARERRSLHFLALLETLRSGTPPFRLALLGVGHGALRHRGRAGGAPAGHGLARVPPGWPDRTRSMAEPLTRALLAPLPPLDEVAWGSALADARRCAGRTVGPTGRRWPFRVTDHAVRLALGTDGAGSDERDSFAWSARTARRALGLAALRSLVAGESRAPLDAVRARVAEIARLVHDGSPSVSGFDRWLAGLPPAGRAAVGAEAVTWATRLWCALDWRAIGAAVVIGRDRWWDSPHSALLALRSRAEVRAGCGSLVVLTGPAAGLGAGRALPRHAGRVVAQHRRRRPGRVVGWWPDSGHWVRLEPEPAVLALATEAVAQVLAGSGAALRSAA